MVLIIEKLSEFIKFKIQFLYKLIKYRICFIIKIIAHVLQSKIFKFFKTFLLFVYLIMMRLI